MKPGAAVTQQTFASHRRLRQEDHSIGPSNSASRLLDSCAAVTRRLGKWKQLEPLRELKAPAKALRARQREFDLFRAEYNDERPHEAIEDPVPRDLYRPSCRQYPRRIPQLEYSSHFDVRKVVASGCVRWLGGFVQIGKALTGEWMEIEPGDRMHQVY